MFGNGQAKELVRPERRGGKFIRQKPEKISFKIFIKTERDEEVFHLLNTFNVRNPNYWDKKRQ